MKAYSSAFMKRAALAVIGQALPEASALNAIIIDICKGIAAAIVAAILFAALLLVVCAGLYRYLLAEQFSADAALGIVAACLCALIIISGMTAKRWLSSAGKAKHRLRLCKKPQPTEPGASAEDIISCFINGFKEAQHTPEPPGAGDNKG